MYPENWKIEPFVKLARYETGRTPSRANPTYWNDPNGKPWVSIADMENYGIITTTKEKVSQHAFDQVFRDRISPAGTLIMSFKLTIGRVSTLGIDACHNEAIISIFPRSDVNQDYLGYFLSQIDYAELQDRQVKGNTLNQDKINRIEVALPPPSEQQTIATTLNLTRKAIETQNNALQTAQELKRAAMRELFTKGLRGEPQKQTDIGLVPESWDVKAVGGYIHKPDYGFTASASSEAVGPRFLRITDIQDGGVNWDTVPFCVSDTASVASKGLKKNDIVVARIGATTGKAFIIGECPEAIFASYLIRIRADETKLVPAFLYYYMQTDAYWQHIDQHKGGRLKGGVNIPILLSLPIPIVEKEEQHKIAQILDAIDRKIDLHKRKKAVLEELFKSLLHKLMTGEIRVSDLDLTAIQAGGH